MGGSNALRRVWLEIPFESYPTAAEVSLRRGAGEVTVYESLLYVDRDYDGLDADQELQLCTSDQDADTDDDGVSDYMEWIRGTQPTNAASVNVTLYADCYSGSDSYDGLSASVNGTHGPKATIRGAFAVAYSNDVVQAASGSYSEGGLWPLAGGRLTLRPIGNVTIR